jgi:hypothetical protein
MEICNANSCACGVAKFAAQDSLATEEIAVVDDGLVGLTQPWSPSYLGSWRLAGFTEIPGSSGRGRP